MTKLEQKIDLALKKEPDYSKMDDLSADVWRKIRASQHDDQPMFAIPNGLKFATVALSLIALVAISQISFQKNSLQADIFDLRYFSYQASPTFQIASLNRYEMNP